jgi:enterochelin esterase family protein
MKRGQWIVIAMAMVAGGAVAQERPRATQPSTTQAARRGPAVVSPEVSAERKLTFRIVAAKAEAVRLNSSDLPGDPQQRSFKKGANDVWELALGPVDPGTFRYTFSVDGVSVVDPRNPAVSESNSNVWSVLHVPGAPFMDNLAEVPHGAVAAVHYRSTLLNKDRRMHVYTPPGYEAGQDKYPVFYLLHGAGDCDDSWTSVGRANFILDNLIAAGKAKPMVVVMPAGHTGPFMFGAPPATAPTGGRANTATFEQEFVKDIRPYVESHYRVLTDRDSRAIAGLSMGGAQTLNIALPNMKDFGYVGVFSSGILSRNFEDWQKQHQGDLEAAASAKDGLKLLWFATGSQDFLLNQTRRTVELLKNRGLNPMFKETTGGHTWINWQRYLDEFAPQLFAGERR